MKLILRRNYETLDRKRLGYRGYVIHNNKSKGYLEIFKNGKYVERIWNNSHESITEAKSNIDYLIKCFD